MGIISVSAQQQVEFVAELNGTEVSPPVNTTATGIAKFVLAPLLLDNYVVYNISASGIYNVNGIHLHNGPRMLNGTLSNDLPILPNYEETGVLSTGNISKSDVFQFELAAKGGFVMDVLSDYLQGGEMYVDIHTEQHPEGEIRGQIFPSR